MTSENSGAFFVARKTKKEVLTEKVSRNALSDVRVQTISVQRKESIQYRNL